MGCVCLHWNLLTAAITTATTIVKRHSTHYPETGPGNWMALPTVLTSHGRKVGLESTSFVPQARVDYGVGSSYLELILFNIWSPRLLKGRNSFSMATSQGKADLASSTWFSTILAMFLQMPLEDIFSRYLREKYTRTDLKSPSTLVPHVLCNIGWVILPFFFFFNLSFLFCERGDIRASSCYGMKFIMFWTWHPWNIEDLYGNVKFFSPFFYCVLFLSS